MTRKSVSAIVFKEGKLYVAKAIGVELASQGKTKKEALNNLREALQLLLEDDNIKLLNLPKKPELASISYA